MENLALLTASYHSGSFRNHLLGGVGVLKFALYFELKTSQKGS